MDMTWRKLGACRGMAPAVFYPAYEKDAEPAKLVCAKCPVCDDCLGFALRTRQEDGVWGGLTEKERRRIVRNRRDQERRRRSA